MLQATCAPTCPAISSASLLSLQVCLHVCTTLWACNALVFVCRCTVSTLCEHCLSTVLVGHETRDTGLDYVLAASMSSTCCLVLMCCTCCLPLAAAHAQAFLRALTRTRARTHTHAHTANTGNVRAATVTATKDSVVFIIDAPTFERMLGPCTIRICICARTRARMCVCVCVCVCVRACVRAYKPQHT